jgi:hypothetical protein
MFILLLAYYTAQLLAMLSTFRRFTVEPEDGGTVYLQNLGKISHRQKA